VIDQVNGKNLTDRPKKTEKTIGTGKNYTMKKGEQMLGEHQPSWFDSGQLLLDRKKNKNWMNRTLIAAVHVVVR